MDESGIKELLKRLDASLSLKLNPLEESATDQERIARLDSFGFSPSEIANILGTTGDKVSKQLYVIRNRKKK